MRRNILLLARNEGAQEVVHALAACASYLIHFIRVPGLDNNCGSTIRN